MKQWIKVSYRDDRILPKLDREIEEALKAIGFFCCGTGYYLDKGKRELNFERKENG